MKFSSNSFSLSINISKSSSFFKFLASWASSAFQDTWASISLIILLNSSNLFMFPASSDSWVSCDSLSSLASLGSCDS